MQYDEDSYLMISGIQHYEFCPRRWSLIHIEELWHENYLTASGRILHKKAHDGNQVEKRGNLIIVRALKISSKLLGVSGECDVVEFYESKKGITLKSYDGLWMPYPVEYKRGKPQIKDGDRLQLCAQAVCLEEMLCCKIEKGAIFYGEPRRREVVEFSEELREKLKLTTDAMHKRFARKHTPKAKTGKFCTSCSLKDFCLPKLNEEPKNAVRRYLEENME